MSSASAATVIATGTNPAVCNQTVGSATSVVAYRLSGGDCVVEFKNVGATTWTVPTGASTVQYLIVAGGASGTRGVCGVYWGQGGGGGEVLSGTRAVTPGMSETISVGAGGARSGQCPALGNPGETSTFSTLNARPGQPGNNVTTGNSGRFGGVSGNGNVGGTGTANGSSCSGGDCGTGGGGGAGGIGGVGNARNGGVGISSAITGTSTGYGGGGAGSNGTPGTASDGGSTGADAPSNRGGGGADGNFVGGDYGSAGGSGIVIIRYTPDATAPSTSLSITPSYLTSGTSISTTLATNETLSSVTLYYSTSSNLSSPQSCGTTSNPTNGQSLICTIPATDATYYLYSRGTDVAGNVEVAPVSADDSIVRDTVAPTITNVTSTATNGAYTVGATPPIYVDFSETVTVTTTGGRPTLLMETGLNDRTASYVAGTGTTQLNFTYTVQAGDTSADLDYVATDSLVLNGGTITDAAGNSAVITLPSPGGTGSLSANKALVIDTTAPSLLSASLSSSGTSLTLTYNETLSSTTAATNRFTVTRSSGGAVSVTAIAISGSSATLTISTVYAGQSLTLSYADPTAGDDANAIQDVAKNDASSFTNVVVTNNSTQTLTQTISISSLGTSSKTYPYSQSLSITTSGTSGTGTITYAVTNGTATGCALSDTTSATTTLTSTSFGTCLLTATIAADITYQSATSTSSTFTFIQALQSTLTITSTTIPYGQSLSLTTSGGSGTGAITFVVNTGNCSITTATLTSTSTGSCSVTATKAADTNYLAESTTATITITTGSATATIAFSSTTLTFGVSNPITVTVSTAGSVRFLANGRVIKNCKSITTITGGSITATCNYRPATRRPLTITARFTPTDLNIAPRTSTSAQFLVQRRTGVRG